MRESLTVSGGGAILITTEAIKEAATRARAAATEARDLIATLDRIDPARPATAEIDSWSAEGIGWELGLVRAELGRRAELLDTVADDALNARHAYLTCERLLNGFLAGLNASIWPFGLMSPRDSALPLPFDHLGWTAWSVARFADLARQLVGPRGALTSDDRLSLLSTETGVDVQRLLVDHLARVPYGGNPVAAALAEASGLDDEVKELFISTVVAPLVTALPGMRDGAVGIRTVDGRRVDTRPVDSLEKLVERIPDGDTDDGRIRVDVVQHDDGATSVVVYLGGTHGDPDQPWDNSSNVVAEGGQGSGSQRATDQAIADALRAAGLPADTPLTLVGYSQGGLIASRLAESGSWNVTGVFTVGSPGTWIELPDETAHLAIEHREDSVVAINGAFSGDNGAVVVTGSGLDGEQRDGYFRAHGLDTYATTAGEADLLDDEAVERERAAILTAVGGTTVSSTTYAAHRLPEGAGASVSAGRDRPAGAGSRR